MFGQSFYGDDFDMLFGLIGCLVIGAVALWLALRASMKRAQQWATPSPARDPLFGVPWGASKAGVAKALARGSLVCCARIPHEGGVTRQYRWAGGRAGLSVSGVRFDSPVFVFLGNWFFVGALDCIRLDCLHESERGRDELIERVLEALVRRFGNATEDKLFGNYWTWSTPNAFLELCPFHRRVFVAEEQLYWGEESPYLQVRLLPPRQNTT